MDDCDKQIEEFNRQQAFIRNAMPGEWLSVAQELHDAATLVWSCRDEAARLEAEEQLQSDGVISPEVHTLPGINRSYFLLAGFALENAVKGLLIAQNPEYISQGELRGGLATHRLTTLIARIPDLALSDSEATLCHALEAAIPSWGRYPVPKRPRDLTKEIPATRELWSVYTQLFSRVARKLYVAIRDGWDSGVGPAMASYWSRDLEELL